MALVVLGQSTPFTVFIGMAVSGVGVLLVTLTLRARLRRSGVALDSTAR
jgi:hypothetical protein